MSPRDAAIANPLAASGGSAKTMEVLPPEGVPLRFEIAPLGARLGAQIVDIVITLLGMAALLIFLAATGATGWRGALSVGALLFFLIRVPYYAISEVVWNGQTLGKKICRIRVISGTGRSLTAYQLVVRNLMREMEVFAPGTVLLVSPGSLFEGIVVGLWVLGLIAVPVLSKRNQRLGDIVANTFVVQQPIAVLHADLAAERETAKDGEYEFFPHQLDHYGAYELQVLADMLQNTPQISGIPGASRRSANLEAVGKRIRKKIDYAYPVAPKDEEAFLKAFYRVQRAYLEQKKLFGEARADKHHADRKDGSPDAAPR